MEERAEWLDQGWQLGGKMAYKALILVVMEGQGSPEDERLKASMVIKGLSA